MTQKQFEKYAKEGKTVVSMDFVEGREGMCTTGVAGNPQIYLDQISKKLGYILLQVHASAEQNVDIPKIMDLISDNAKVYYAKFAAYYAKQNGEKVDDKVNE